MTAIIDGVVIDGTPEEINHYVLVYAKSVVELQEALQDALQKVITQRTQFTEKDHKTVSDYIKWWRNEK